MRTSEVAGRAGVNPPTLRYYERRGLLPQPPRSTAGYRSYTQETVRLVLFVKRAQRLRFSLAEAGSLLRLGDGGPESCDAARTMTADRLRNLHRRVTELRATRDAPDRLGATCEQPPDRRDCPLLAQIARDAAAPVHDETGERP